MTVSRAERVLLSVTLVAVLYRIVKEEWPVAIEVSE